VEELFLISLSLFVLLPGNRKISGMHTLTSGRTGIRVETFKEQSVNKNFLSTPLGTDLFTLNSRLEFNGLFS